MRPQRLIMGAVMAASIWTANPEAQAPAPRFRMIVIGELKTENGSEEIHRPFVEAGTSWLNKLAQDSGFTVAYLNSPNTLTDAMLAGIDLIWQMNYTPYRWTAPAKAAFEKYLAAGKGGWVGNHHAALYGPVLTQDSWPFFHKLLGEINYRNYISKFASGDVRVEDAAHPVFKGVPAVFNVSTEEWYTWDKSPRPKVRVLANVDENSYKFVSASESGIKMGDHPVVWTYEGYSARNLFVFMGHHPNLFQNAAYTTMMRNAIFWAANKQTTAIPGPVRPDERADAMTLRQEGRYILLPAESLRDVMVLDAAGRKLYHARGESLTGRIDRSGWGAGAYLIRAFTAKGPVSQWLNLD
jgi:uncharacterized protein